MTIISELVEKRERVEKLNEILIKKIKKRDKQATLDHNRKDFLKREILKIKPNYCFDDSEEFKRKRRIRARDKNLCCFCKRNILDVSLDETLHHKIPRRYGGKDTAKNQITICEDCHRLLEELIGYVEREILKLNNRINSS